MYLDARLDSSSCGASYVHMISSQYSAIAPWFRRSHVAAYKVMHKFTDRSHRHELPPDVWDLQFVEEFSQVPWQEFPGGRYKASTNATLTGSTIAGALFQLKPGGVRELHWHDVAEWAMVIKGTCRWD